MSRAPSWRVWFRGKPTCPCVTEWFPVYERMLKKRGITSGFYDGRTLAIMQLTGTAAASAGTHSGGGAIDTAMLDPRGIRLAREMGASASWVRWWPGNLHSHLVLDGCPHNGPARYQVAAVKAGFDGLGAAGRGGTDTEWRPATWRTWQQGLAWARDQLDTRTPLERLLDTMDEKKLRGIIRAEARAAVKAETPAIVMAVWRRKFWDYKAPKKLRTVSDALFTILARTEEKD